MKRSGLCIASAMAILAIAATPASAKVLRNTIGHFDGQGAPDGPLGLYLLSDAVDNSTGPSNGDVYVLETGNETTGQGLVDKFTATGSYAGVQITGAETAFGSFEFGPFESGVAVDGSASLNSGDVYVADTEHHVVDRFSETGQFLCQIAGAETEKEIEKTAPTAKECDPSGSGIGGVLKPTGLAVDGGGDVYVADDEHAAVQELGPEGHLIRTIAGEGSLSDEMAGIALDSSGDLYVTKFDSSVVQLGPAGEFLRELGSESFGVAVDQSTTPNRVYVDHVQELSEFDPSGTLRDMVTLPGTFWPGLAVDQATGDVYAASAQFIGGTPEGVEILGPATVLPNVATEAAGEVGEMSAVLHGTVEPDSAHGGGSITSCRFEYVTEAQYAAHPSNRYEGAASAPCEAPSSLPYTEAEQVKATVSLSPSTIYHFRVLAGDSEGINDGAGEAKPEAMLTTSGAPTIEDESASAGTRTAKLTAQIDPHGFATTCHVQYVDEADFNASGYEHATTLPCAPEALGSGAMDQSASAEAGGLQVGTTYHYRFVASNGAGSTTGADETFATFGIQSFSVETLDAEGHPYTQAGGHPYVLRTSFALNTNGGEAQANVRDTETRLPAGLIGNPTAVARCTREALTYQQCPGAAQVGIVTLQLSHGEFRDEPLYNLVPPEGVPAEFGVRFNTYTNVYIDSNVRTGGDYGVTARVSEASAAAGVIGATVELWGVPAAESHNAQRACPVPGFSKEQPNCSAGVAPTPFLREPTSCGGELSASMSMDAWQDPGAFVSRTTTMPALTGCELPDFTPSLSIQPTTTQADSSSGLGLALKLPQNQALESPGESDLKDAVVTLPAGMTVNPAAANGRQACGESQIGLHDAEPASGVGGCPENSKLGTVEIETPLLAKPLQGSVYLASQNANPFGSLLAIYIAAEGEGARVKLAGHVEANQETGQLTTTFDENPQLPFDELRLRMFGGPQGVLATPQACGSYVSEGRLSPWDGLAASALDEPFQIAAAAGGGACPAGGAGGVPFDPASGAGTTSSQAGAFSPFTFMLSRQDGEQRFGGVSVTMPPGLEGVLTGVPLCGEAQANAGTCEAQSQIGEASVTSGVGSQPVPIAGGRVYLTGPYNGGPFGLSIVVPAVAGPFDLGNVVVRSSIRVDPHTAQITVISDTLPQMVNSVEGLRSGVPADLRTIAVAIDGVGGGGPGGKPFIFNPTDCEALSVNAIVTGVQPGAGSGPGTEQGSTANLSSPFHAANCATLKFTPKFTASVSGKTSKADGASLTAKIVYPSSSSPGRVTDQANISYVKVQLPKQLPSRLTTLQKACPAKTFEAGFEQCLKLAPHSKIGEAVVHTPLLPVPLKGPAIFVSHGGEAFPNLIVVLQGYGVTVDLVGDTDIKRGVTSTTFKSTPDVPFSTFELKLPEGPYSALAANGNLCREQSALKMPTAFVAQNGATLNQDTQIAIEGCKPAIYVVKHTVKGHTATLVVSVPSAGKLVASAKGLSKAAKSTAAGTVTVKLRLTKQTARTPSRPRDLIFTAKIHLTFTPKHGGRLKTITTVDIG
jgi:hypothetical protein